MYATSPLDRTVGLLCAIRVSHEGNWGNRVARGCEYIAEGFHDIMDKHVECRVDVRV